MGFYKMKYKAITRNLFTLMSFSNILVFNFT